MRKKVQVIGLAGRAVALRAAHGKRVGGTRRQRRHPSLRSGQGGSTVRFTPFLRQGKQGKEEAPFASLFSYIRASRARSEVDDVREQKEVGDAREAMDWRKARRRRRRKGKYSPLREDNHSAIGAIELT